MTPAEEVHAASAKIRNVSVKLAIQSHPHLIDLTDWALTEHGADSGAAVAFVSLWSLDVAELVAQVLDRLAADMEANEGLPGYCWVEGLALARAINGRSEGP